MHIHIKYIVLIMVLKLLSFNQTGVLQEVKRSFISDILVGNAVDFAFLQETWLLKSNSSLLGKISTDYMYNAVSGMDCSKDIIFWMAIWWC